MIIINISFFPTCHSFHYSPRCCQTHSGILLVYQISFKHTNDCEIEYLVSGECEEMVITWEQKTDLDISAFSWQF